MKATGGPQKLRFTIQACSGEDSDYPVRELLYHSPQTRGWQSPRFCKYPQEFVLRLERQSKIQQIQILAHEYKIPTKIEVFVGPDAADATANMRRLGYLSFDSNERSNHQARELKSVHVSVEAQLVRLLIHRCHVNKLNIYNQVGVIALNLIGETVQPAPEGPAPYLSVQPPASHDLPYYNRAAAEVADLQLDMHVDSQTAARIKELVRLKDAAVAAEDYDEAKHLKSSIERLKVVGSKIAQLEARKRLAVEREDYDLAKALKVDIEKLRVAGESAAVGGGPAGTLSSGGPDAAAGDVAAAYGAAADGVTSPRALGGMQQQRSIRYSDGATAAGVQDGSSGTDSAADASRGIGVVGGSFKGGGYDSAVPVVHTYQAYEDRPAVAKAAYIDPAAGEGVDIDDNALMTADPTHVSAAAMFGSGRMRSSAGGAAAAKTGSLHTGGAAGNTATRPAAAAAAVSGAGVGAPAPSGWPGDLPPPEPLSAGAAKDAEPVSEIAGDFVAAAFFSKNWQLRDAAAAWLVGLVANGRVNDQRELAKGLMKLAVKGLKDKVPQVYNSSLSLMQALLTALGSGGNSRDVCQAVETALPVLLERLSDNNPRLRDSARDALIALAQEPEGRGALRSLAGQLCRPPKSQLAWRPVLAMLQLMVDLVPLVGLAGTAASGGGRNTAGDGGFDLHELMDYVGKALNSANAEVRAAALKVAIAAAGCAAGGTAAVRRLLPQDLNPKLKEQVDAALGSASDAAAASPPAAAPAPHSKQQRAPGGGAGTSGGGTGSRAAGKPAATNSQHPNRQAAATNSQHPNRQAAAAAPATGQTPRQRQQQQQPQASPGDLGADDPAPFIRELSAREQQYGAQHAAVAESCSNLAILYNQKGDYGAAQPLYERALAIYESTYGPNHQEVAHTLTDLAVLHLEQGHDAIGRPLLERALAIQEAALGPDHPDVVAIRDVLNSE